MWTVGWPPDVSLDGWGGLEGHRHSWDTGRRDSSRRSRGTTCIQRCRSWHQWRRARGHGHSTRSSVGVLARKSFSWKAAKKARSHRGRTVLLHRYSSLTTVRAIATGVKDAGCRGQRLGLRTDCWARRSARRPERPRPDGSTNRAPDRRRRAARAPRQAPGSTGRRPARCHGT